MNKYLKTLAICVMLLLTGSVAAAPAADSAAAPEAQSCAPVQASPLEMLPCQSVYVPQMGAFVVIDSIDCCVDLLVRQGDSAVRVGRFITEDNLVKRHDLKNIVRPRSVAVIGHCIVVLASSQKDSSYLALVPMCQSLHGGQDTMQAAQKVAFSNTAYAFRYDEAANEFVVVGKNAVGYDLNVVGFDKEQNLVATSKFHYHVPKQSEKILASDPHGYGLTLVAVAVVFIALICICFIMKLFASSIQKAENRKSAKAAAKSGAAAPVSAVKSADVSGEVYAAIAAAIYAYDEDMHDEEDTVITIQKVERAWTPWNAKFYNMNKYFANRK